MSYAWKEWAESLLQRGKGRRAQATARICC
jgi:hypothetical protein